MSRTDAMASWDAIAESFDATRQKPWPLVLKFIENLPTRNVLLDLGCGNGRHLLPAAEHSAHAIGVDFSRKLLTITQKKIRERQVVNVSLMQADLMHLPLDESTADAIVFIAALHNIVGRENRRQALREVHRVLQPDGRALISVWSRWQDAYRRHFLREFFRHTSEFGDIELIWRQHQLNIPRFYHLYSRSEFLRDLAASDLEVRSLQATRFFSRVSPDNYFAVVAKH